MIKLKKALIIGLGSMGQRRMRLIDKIFNSQIKVIGVEIDAVKRQQCEEKIKGIELYGTLKEAFAAYGDEGPKVAFVCTSPLSHGEIIHECLLQGFDIFSELNLVADRYHANMALAKECGRKLFISSTFLYRKEIDYIIKQMKSYNRPVNYLYHVGQYLPDWHPWESIENFFVSDKRTNACRELLAIELPWLLRSFGKVANFSVMRSKMSCLNIDYDDNYFLVIEHENGNKGMVAIDVVSREAERQLKIIGENIFLQWNGTPDSLKVKDLQAQKLIAIDLYRDEVVSHDKKYSDNIIENAYENEIRQFLAVIAGKEANKYSFADDYEVLKLIDKIEGIR